MLASVLFRQLSAAGLLVVQWSVASILSRLAFKFIVLHFGHDSLQVLLLHLL